MLESSILNSIYILWLQSAVYRFFSACYRPFKRAFDNSAFRRLVTGGGKIRGWYSASLIGRFIDGFFAVVCGVFGAVWGFLRRLAGDGFTARFCKRFISGSFILSYEFIFGAFVCVMFMLPHDMWANSYATLAVAALLLLHFVMCGCKSRSLQSFTSLGLSLFLFALVCVLSVLFSFDRSDSIRILILYVTAFLLCWLVSSDFCTRDRLMTLLGFLYASVLITALYGFAQRISGIDVSASYTDLSINAGVPGRVFSTLDNPNNYAAFLVMTTPLCAAFAVSVKRPGLRVLLCCGLALPLLALVMTYSRAAWIAIMLSAIIIVWFSNKKVLPLFFFVCLMAVPILPSSILTRISTLFVGGDSSNQYRLYIWRGVLNILADYLPAGIGLGPESFSTMYDIYALPQATLGVSHSHMLFLELLLETGVLGLITFLCFYLRTLFDDMKTLILGRADASIKPIVIGSCAALVGMAFSFCVDYVLFYPRDMFAFFLLCGISMASVRAASSGASGQTEAVK